MHFPTTALVFLLGVSSQVNASPSPRYPLPQRSRNIPAPRNAGAAKRDYSWGSPSYTPNATRAAAVKETYQIAWDGYYKYAFPHDSLLPVTKNFSDDRNGWGASAVDGLSTALIQENVEVANLILEYIPTIDFTKTSTEISLFETTIRYLGGLLSGYDLASGPLKHVVNDESLVPKLLEQAVILADGLSVAFDTPSGVPDNSVFFDPDPRKGNNTSNGIATIGTLILEWQRLSDLTGNETYGELAKKGESYLIDVLNPEVGEPFPGLIGTNVNISNGLFLDGSGGWNGGDDSFYEYLIKAYLYDPAKFAEYKDRWILAVDSSIQYLASSPTTNEDLTFLAYYDNTTLGFGSTHLGCFDGGNFILGGLTLQVKEYVEFGLALVDGCYDTYSKTATGIGPEVFAWQDSNTPLNATNNQGPPTAADAAFYKEAGFWVTNSVYALRPEVLESIYYAYRATGDEKYQEWAWEAYLAINSTTRVGSGYSDIQDVNVAGGGGFLDFQESFFFAEVLKYAYIIHASDATWQVQADRTNQFVFNTEAHPLRIQAGVEKPWLETP